MRASAQLKMARLWEGSTLQLADKYGSLDRKCIERQIKNYRKSDDLTDNEIEFLGLLQAELEFAAE